MKYFVRKSIAIPCWRQLCENIDNFLMCMIQFWQNNVEGSLKTWTDAALCFYHPSRRTLIDWWNWCAHAIIEKNENLNCHIMASMLTWLPHPDAEFCCCHGVSKMKIISGSVSLSTLYITSTCSLLLVPEFKQVTHLIFELKIVCPHPIWLPWSAHESILLDDAQAHISPPHEFPNSSWQP